MTGPEVYRRRQAALAAKMTAGLAVTVAIMIVATGIGAVDIPPRTVLVILARAVSGRQLFPSWPVDPSFVTIMLQLRLPRVLLAALVGASLGLAGAAMQGFLRNPMADPYITGVSSGAALGATIAIVAGVPVIGWWSGSVPVFAFAGAVAALSLVLFLGRVNGTLAVVPLILAGVAVSSLLSAVVSLMMVLHEPRLEQVFFWLMGGFSGRGWTEAGVVAGYLLVCGFVLMGQAVPLNALALGDDDARSLGVDVRRSQYLVLGASAVLTAAAVSESGLIGFVGLVVPHMARLVVGPDHRFLLPASGLGGAALMVLADLVARLAMRPAEIPVGVITALVGGPFFLYLLHRTRRAGAGWASR